MKRLMIVLLALPMTTELAAAVSGAWQVTLTRSGEIVQPPSTGATQAEAWDACLARIPRVAADQTIYQCHSPRYEALVKPDPGKSGPGTDPAAPLPVRVEPSPGSGETVGAWSQRSFTQPFRISMEPDSYPVWVAGGATHRNLAGAWDGSRLARITPPTSEQTYGGIGAFPLPEGVRTLSLRWEMRAGPTYASGGQGFVDNKHVIIHTAGGNRAMMSIQSTGSGCLQMAIAQGTVKQFNQRAQGGKPAGWWAGENNDLFRWCDKASGAKAIPAGEWLSIELQVSCATTLHASGHIRALVTRRSGKQYDWWIPWNYDAPARCSNFTNVEGIGDYYNGRGDGAPGTYFDIAGVTFATNRATLLGPRAGFVQ